MRIVMMTNTYTPVVGGLERSVMSFTAAFRRRGHHVLIVAPTFAGMPRHEPGVLRVPSLQHVTRHDFSLSLPIAPRVIRALVAFRPDIVHAHHPFLMGNTALRLARTCNVPLVFTHHILFEQYAHYLPLHGPAMERFVVDVSTGYANLCDHVIVPSQSLAEHLADSGVTSPITVVPTGVPVERFARGRGAAFRRRLGIPPRAFVVGHIGRLAQEKNLGFMARAVAEFLRVEPRAHCYLAGEGPLAESIERQFVRAGVRERFHPAGPLPAEQLRNAYHAMDVFAFASKSETQGIVLVEAMASGTPVVALDGPGVREIVRDRSNGRLLMLEDADGFVQALQWVAQLPAARRQALRAAAKASAADFSTERCARRALAVYRQARARLAFGAPRRAEGRWRAAVRRIHAEWDVLSTMTRATSRAMQGARRHAGRD